MSYVTRHIALMLGITVDELYFVIENIDNYYYEFRKPKKKFGIDQKDNKGIRYRDLLPSTDLLKEIQQRLNVLLQRIELPEYAYGSVKGANNFMNAGEHIGNKYFFLVDLKNFFPNITHHQVFKMFLRNNFSPAAASILTKLTTYRGGLPQGAPTSPIIANLVFIETGNKLVHIAKDHHLTFTSFLDDLTFSSKTNFKPLTFKLLEVLRKDKFYIHHKKISYKTHKPEITGLVIHRSKLHPIPSMKKRAKVNFYLANYLKSIDKYEITSPLIRN